MHYVIFTNNAVSHSILLEDKHIPIRALKATNCSPVFLVLVHDICRKIHQIVSLKRTNRKRTLDQTWSTRTLEACNSSLFQMQSAALSEANRIRFDHKRFSYSDLSEGDKRWASHVSIGSEDIIFSLFTRFLCSAQLHLWNQDKGFASKY